MRIECCVDSVHAAQLAMRNADRLEVCSRLTQGGYTPGLELLDAVLELCEFFPACNVFAMVRPWCGGKEDFVYASGEERDALNRDLDAMVSRPVHGIVVGALIRDGNGLLDVDTDTIGRICRVADGKNIAALTFHRAFDDIDADRIKSIEKLGGFGLITRILTSGGRGLKSQVTDDGNLEEISRYRQVAGERGISILPGSGIGPENAAQVVRWTGCREIHGSFGAGTLVMAVRASLREVCKQVTATR